MSLISWLYIRTWLTTERPILLFDISTAWLVERRVLLPGVTVLMRLIAQVRERTQQRLWKTLANLPSPEQKQLLDDLLKVPEGMRQSPLDQLRHGPTRLSSTSLVQALQRYEEIRSFGIGKLNVSRIPLSRIHTLSRYVTTAWAPTISRMLDERRIATLVAFIYTYETTALDDALDLLDMLISEIASTAKKLGQQQRLRTIRDLDQAALELRDICLMLLEDSGSEKTFRQRVLSRFSEDHMRLAIATIDNLARPADDTYQQELTERYKKVRRFLPKLLKTVTFLATPSGSQTLQALQFLQSIEGRRKPDFSKAPMEIVSSGWQRLVVDKEDQVNRAAYTLCVLERLQDCLRRRDIFVKASQNWGDSREKLLHGKDWTSKRSQICHSLGLQLTAEKEIQQLSQHLDEAYQKTEENLPTNSAVRIEQENNKYRIVLTGLDKLEEPDSLLALREKVAALLPRIDLPELLLEIQTRTRFADEFTHISENQARVDELPLSVCGVLVAEACNIGLEPIIQTNLPALTRNRLSWIQQNYFRAETIIRANARLVDYQTSISLAHVWGGGEVASADGLRFVTPVRTIHSGPNPKYFGFARGITYYNFTSDQYTGLHGIVIPGTIRDSIYLLLGLLEQQTSLRPIEIMTDTAGVSDVVFGLFWLLGFQFSPRIADVGSARFWRIDSDSDYGALNDIARQRVNIKRITHHWDDMLRIVGSLKLGTINADELIRALLRSDRPSGLTQAIADLGRIPKTIYLLNFIDDETYRRRILTQLNRGEGRNGLARVVCHGQRGEIRKRYKEGQEDQLGALGLVTNAIVLWNTIYMEATLEKIKEENFEVRTEDVARLSPLQYKHINMLGRYSFALTEPVTLGKLRPLHQHNDEGL